MLASLGMVLALVAGGLSAPRTALATFPGHDGVIAYTTPEGSIWALEPLVAGEPEAMLEPGPGAGAPAFSPSGSSLAFQRRTGTTVRIYLAHADGSDPVALVDGEEPAFSPSGKQIVFARPSGLFITSTVPGARVARLTNHRGDSEPQWSVHDQIVFQRTTRRDRHPLQEIEIIAPRRHTLHTVLVYQHESRMWPNWSPSGKTISVALCEQYEPSERAPFPTIPALLFDNRCDAEAFSPEGPVALPEGCQPKGPAFPGYDGRCGFAQAGHRPHYVPIAIPGRFEVTGRPDTSCPAELGDEQEISWQPILAGTEHVPTAPCAGTEIAMPITEPGSASRGAPICIYLAHRKKRTCRSF
jgi:dipeptidyl aminopeptidase/acylaminoacyl peptidase